MAKKSTTLRMVIMLLIVLVVFGGIVGFNLFRAQAIKKFMASQGIPPQTVSTTRVGYEEWQPSLAAVGTVRAVRGVDLAMEVAGLVTEVTLAPGGDAKAGDVLVKLRADDALAQLRALEASAQLAEATFRRSREQLAAKAISQAQHDIDAANLKSAQAAVAQQQAVLAKRTLHAPFAGRLGITSVGPGQYLNAGQVIVTLQQLDPIYVDFSVPQRELAQLRAGRTVDVSLDAFPGKTFRGTVTAVNPKLDPDTRNAQVEALLRNPQHLLMPGMFSNVALETGGKRRYLTLPQTAVTYNPYGETVFIVKRAETKGPDGETREEAVAQETFVTTGERRGDQVAILKGLEEGTEVVTTGQLKLKNGTPLVIDNRVQPANDPNPKPQEQ